MISHYSFHAPSASTQSNYFFIHSLIYLFNIYLLNHGARHWGYRHERQHFWSPAAYRSARLHLWAINLSVPITWNALFLHPTSTPAWIPPRSQCLLSPDSNISFFLKPHSVHIFLQAGRNQFLLSKGMACHLHSQRAMSHFPLKTVCSWEEELCQFHICIWKNIRYNAVQVLITQLNLVEWTSLLEMHRVNEAFLSLRF